MTLPFRNHRRRHEHEIPAGQLDGPYAESKELIVAFAIVEVKSREEAIAASRRFYEIAGEGEGTIQRILEPGDFGSP